MSGHNKYNKHISINKVTENEEKDAILHWVGRESFTDKVTFKQRTE